MRFIVVESADSQVLWDESDWPAVPRKGETVVFGGRELEVLDVDHDLVARELRVWVRVPRIDLRSV